MIRIYKRKLILTKAQEQKLRSFIGACRTVYNLGLEIRIEAYKKCQKPVHKYELMKQMTVLRQDIDWIRAVPHDCLTKIIERLDKSYQAFFKGSGFPKYANKKTFNSIDFRDITVKNNGYIVVPGLGKLKIFKDSAILGDARTATIKIESTGFFICVACKDVPKKFDSENQTIGLDMGITNFCTDNNGAIIENPTHFKIYERQLRIENRSLSRKKKGSNSWRKQVKRLGLLHRKISNVRRDFLHKESTKIAKANNVVYLENINISGMTKNKNLSKHILDCGWATFRTMLSYKTNVVAINPAYTSQTCSKCGCIDSVNRVSQSEFKCTSCGHIANADVNAAKNIKRIGSTLNRERKAVA